MAPRRWAPKTHALIRELLIARDGPNCRLCQAEPSDPLEIDHIDRNTGNGCGANLRLLCRTCNLARRRPKSGKGGINERERQLDYTDALAATEQARLALPYSDGSPEMRASGYYEIRYRSWLLQSTPLLRQEAINAGAEQVGCSPLTAQRYLSKLTSSTGPLTTTQDPYGNITVVRR